MRTLALLATLAVAAAAAVAALTHARPALADVPVQTWSARFSALTSSALASALNTRKGKWRRSLIRPFAETYGGDAAAATKRGLSFAISSKAKLVNMAKRKHSLTRFFKSKYPDVDLVAFRAWSRDVFNAYAESLGLAERDLAGSVDGTEHRSLIVGMTAALVLDHNARADASDPDAHLMGLTHFSALDSIEATAFMGFERPANETDAGARRRLVTDDEDAEFRRVLQSAPSSYDMRTLGQVGPVKDQGGCGSCWAFAAVNALETAIKVRLGGPVVALSEQHVLSCNNKYTQCDGGDAGGAYQWIASQANGITTTANWPYYSGLYCNARGVCQEQACDATKKTQGVATVARTSPIFTTLTTDNQVKAAVMSKGSVVLTLDATCLQTYRSGIVRGGCGCQNTEAALNHQVAIIGWDDSTNTMLVRNQWSASWGEAGHFRIARGAAPGTCGMYRELLIPTNVGYSGAVSPTTPPPAPTPTVKPTTQPPAVKPTTKPTTQPPASRPTTRTPTVRTNAPVAKPTRKQPTAKPTRRRPPTKSPTRAAEYEYEYE